MLVPYEVMEFLLDSVAVRLIYTDKDLDDQLDLIFRDWPSGRVGGSHYHPTADNYISDTIVLFSLEVLNQQPEVPCGIPFFQEATQTTVDASGKVSLYKDHNGLIIYFDDGVRIHLPPLERLDKDEVHLHAVLSRRLLLAGRLEDVLFAGLAPLLRRHGYSLLHGFSAATPKGATLIIGPSGSGKTTVGLGLTVAGWGYLANDVVLLKRENDGIYALPVPGAIGLTARTFELLPELQLTLKREHSLDFLGKKYFPVVDLVRGWSMAARINLICMPDVSPELPTQLTNSNKAIALARLLESSLDRWDTANFEDQIDLLKDLVGQAQVYVLKSGTQINKWSELL